jgi:hypothetical protein
MQGRRLMRNIKTIQEKFQVMGTDVPVPLLPQEQLVGISPLSVAGGVIAYKSKYQPTIALCSTEAEFTAVSEAGKMTL